MMAAKLTRERLLQVLSYEKESGYFRWRAPTFKNFKEKVGSVAGLKKHDGRGYIVIRIDGAPYMAHRLAWFYEHGEWPAGQIDHINGQRNDNRLANIRVVSARVNAQNMRKPMRNNKSGYLGVSMHRCGRYVSYIRVNGKKRFLGLFDDPAIAHAAYVEAKRALHPGCTI